MKRQLKDYITTEPLKNRFPDSFALVNYAISLGAENIKAGRAFHTSPDIKNQAYQILTEIHEGKDKLPPPAPKRVEEEE